VSRNHDISRAINHVIEFPKPSTSVFAYCKWSNTGGEKAWESG